MGHGFRLDRRQDHVMAVTDNDRPRTSAIGRINQHAPIPRFLDNAFDRCRLRAHNRDNPVRRYDVPKSNVNQLNIHLEPSNMYIIQDFESVP